MKKIFDFGKICYEGKAKNNRVTVEIRFENGCFLAWGNIYDSSGSDYLCTGQCLDIIAEYIHTPTFKKMYQLWKLYHAHAGTPEQENAIITKFDDVSVANFEEQVDYLKSIGLYEVEYEGKPYRYGSSWLKWGIPTKDIKEIESLFTEV